MKLYIALPLIVIINCGYYLLYSDYSPIVRICGLFLGSGMVGYIIGYSQDIFEEKDVE